MKKVLLINFQVSAGLYLIGYLVKSFITWTLTNPFDWILGIPTWTVTDRGCFLFSYACYQAVLISIISAYLSERKRIHHENHSQLNLEDRPS